MKKTLSAIFFLIILLGCVLMSGCTPENKSSATYIGNDRTATFDAVIDDDTNQKDVQIFSFGDSRDKSFGGRGQVEKYLISTMNNERYRISSVQIIYKTSTALFNWSNYVKGDIVNVKLGISDDKTKPSLRMKIMVASDFLEKEGSAFVNKEAVGVDIYSYLKINDYYDNTYYYVFYLDPPPVS